MIKDVYIVGATRTPVGSYGGSLKNISACSLATIILDAVVKRAGIEKNIVDKIFMGNCFEPLDNNVSRIAAIKSGFPFETSAITINATCGSALQAIICGIQSIHDGEADVVIAGGVESMSTAPYILTTVRWGQRLKHGEIYDLLWRAMQEYPIGGGMGITAENLAEKYNISREEQDMYAFLSHQKACNAIQRGVFKEEIFSITLPSKNGQPKIVDTDEHPRQDVTLEKLAQLQPVFKKNGTVTAGNSCGLNDGAAAIVLMNEKKVKEYNVKPLAQIVSYGVVGVDPAYMGIGPVPAIKKAVSKIGLDISDIGLFEINEAFAAQYLACERELGLQREIVNVNGGGIALGHPVGATGCRLLVTLVYEMRRRSTRYGVASLCAGGGHGFAVVIENMA